MGKICLYLASNERVYIGQFDLFLLINYWSIPEDQLETITKSIHQGISYETAGSPN